MSEKPARVGLFFLDAIGKARVAEAGADGQYAPALDVAHERHFAQALNHRIVVHEHSGAVLADFRDPLEQARRQIEFAALPVARQILRAAVDRSVRLDDAGTADTDERGKSETFLLGAADQFLQHLNELLDRLLARHLLLVGVAPKLELPYSGFGQIGRPLAVQFD